MNFLPIDEQIKIKKRYKEKFFLFLASVLFFASLINLILVFPSYVFLKIKNNDLKKEYEVLRSDSIFLKSEKMNSSLNDLDKNIKFLKTGGEDTVDFSKILNEIIKLKNSKVSLASISFEKDKIVLLGNAKTREALLIFIQNLKENTVFKSVDSPASNLLRKENVDFTITISLKLNNV